jgi:DNA-binding NtrC family response regulator
MKNVLVVDDDPMVLRALERTLPKTPLECRWMFALGPAAALPLLASERFHAVVSDWAMPQMNGLELLEKVRSESPATIRILLSGGPELPSDRAEPVAHEVLIKPCLAKDLAECLRRHFDRVAG